MPSSSRAAARRFRPQFWPTVLTIPALIVLVGLGTWQVQRLAWKTELNETRTQRIEAPPIALPPADADPATFEFHRVRVAGRFLHERETYLAARSLRGNIGYHVLTPFVLADGRTLLVDRGWIPLDNKDPATRAEGQLAGEVEIEGVLRAAQKGTWITPENRPDKNHWYVVDVPAIARHLGLERTLPYFVEAGPAPNPGGLPIGGQTRVTLPNDHLQYAITWYALAVALAVIYVLYHLKAAREADAGRGDA